MQPCLVVYFLYLLISPSAGLTYYIDLDVPFLIYCSYPTCFISFSISLCAAYKNKIVIDLLKVIKVYYEEEYLIFI